MSRRIRPPGALGGRAARRLVGQRTGVAMLTAALAILAGCGAAAAPHNTTANGSTSTSASTHSRHAAPPTGPLPDDRSPDSPSPDLSPPDAPLSSVGAPPPTNSGAAVGDDEVGLRPDAPPPGIVIAGAADGQSDVIAAHALADLVGFYADVFPTTFGADFHPPSAVVSYDSTDPDSTVCGDSTYDFANAFYSPYCDTLAYDHAVMLPNLLAEVGDLAPAVVLSHEMGHDVQHNLNVATTTPTIVLEQQADCYAGAYWRWVADGHSQHFSFNQTEGMRQLLLALFQSHDPVGFAAGSGSSARDTGEHGNGFDRTYAAVLGYRGGVTTCRSIDAADVAARSNQSPFQGVPPNNGNVAVTSAVLQKILATVDSYFAAAIPGYQPPTLAPTDDPDRASCPGYDTSYPIDYCPSSNTVTYQLGALQQVGTPTAGWDSANGDFSAIVLLVGRYAIAAQQASGASVVGSHTGLRALCYAGGWASWMRHPHGGYQLAPNDLDKAIYQIVSSPVSGSDAAGDHAAPTIDRVHAFDQGVTGSEGDGLDTPALSIAHCNRAYPGSP